MNTEMRAEANPLTCGRAADLFQTSYRDLAVRNDRLFARLLVFEWVAAMLLAFFVTPRTYEGTLSSVHVHVYAAVFLGLLTIALPIYFIRLFPGQVFTRHTIAVAQMVMNGLLIDLTGGRIETHFLIFGSLAFLAFYLDWRVLVTASAVTAADHLLRGLLIPRTIFGAGVVSNFRWLEHAGYVVFEDIFLISSCLFGINQRQTSAARQADLEFTESELRATHENLEHRVAERTSELNTINQALKANEEALLVSEAAARGVAFEREQMALQLKAAKEIAEAATRAKSEFLANMSHEIRTPVTAMVGFADMMLDPGQTQSDRIDGLQTIRRNAKHLLEVINEILDLSKIEAGRMTVENIPTELPPLLSDVLSIMRPRALEKGLELNLRFGEKVPKTVNTDPVRAKQILMNLVSNALKFTEKGRVEIQVSPVPAEGALKFDVVDSGIGISDEQIRKLFKPFTQADGSTTRKFGGTGLGLTISKHLAEMLGGDITVKSTPGLGSTFSAKIGGAGDGTGECCRLEDALMIPQAGVDRIDTRISGRILLAEDGKDNQRFISAMLRKAGAEVGIADNGRIAVDMVRDQSFDLILMDMQMPELDGYAATTLLRRRGHTGPVVALTAHAMADDRAKCIQAGCTDYLVKPIDRRHLIETVARYISNAGAVAAPAPVAPTPAAPTPVEVPAIRSAGEIVSTVADDPVMAEVLGEFVANLSVEVASLRSLVQANDLTHLRHAVHQIKGAGGSYGFQCISDAAAVAEQSLIAGAALEAVRPQVDSLIAMIHKVRGFKPATEASHVG
jgi:signal transduction histidine kinase/CheY-like chemotaxis protein